jgi:O-antigen/teichoic acid export membrane protein
MFVGYILWLILSRLTSPDVIGISSTVISLVVIFSVIVDLGVSRGSTLFLGKSFSEGQTQDANVYVKASLIVVSSGILVCSLAILVFKEWIYPNIPSELVHISILLVGLSAISSLLRSVLIASLQTQLLPIIMIVSSICKIALTITLILLGTGALGITVGYLSAYLSAAILLFFVLRTTLKPLKQASTVNLYHACKNILLASVASWVPRVIAVIGTRLGTIIVFGIEGAGQAGFYFIAFSIYYAIAAVADSLSSILFPVLSGMKDQRKRFVWRMIKISLAVTLPISSAATLYSDEIMGLFGSDYVQASMSLKILLLSILPFTLNIAIGTLVYSYGNYRQVLAVGLGSSISRIICYFVLVPMYGNTGAAISFTLGSIIGFAVSAVVAKKIGMLIFWKELALIFIIPTIFSFVLEEFQVNYIVGVPVILVLSLIIYLALRVLSRSDLRDSLAILPNRIGRPLTNLINKL